MDPTAIVELPRTHINCPWRFLGLLPREVWTSDERIWPQNGGHGWGTTFQNQHEILQFEDPLNKLSHLGISVPWFFIPSDRLALPKGDFLLGMAWGQFFFYKKYTLKNSGWSENLHGGRFHHFIPTKRAHNLHISTPFFSRENVWTHNTLHSGWRRFIINCPNRFVIRSCVDRVFVSFKN